MIQIKVLVLGDTHGNLKWTLHAIRQAKAYGAQHIIQVGDWGFFWPKDTFYGVDTVNAALIENNIQMIFIDGNHDFFPMIEALVAVNPKNSHGQTYVRSNILYSPRGCIWKMDGKRFMTVGGAVSVDRQDRTPGISWWSQEQLTEQEVSGIVAHVNARRHAEKPGVDYLFSHDCHPLTPFGHRLKDDPQSTIHRDKIRRIFSATLPKIWLHGHMHAKYAWPLFHAAPFEVSDEHTEVYGLNCDGMANSFGILNTEDGSFTFDEDLKGSIVDD